MVRREAEAEVRAASRRVSSRIGVALAILIVEAVPCDVSANKVGPVAGFTGAPGELLGTPGQPATCAYPGCHTFFGLLEEPPGTLTIDAPASYEPGMTYEITVHLAQMGQSRWGFELTVLDELLAQRAGTLVATDVLNTQVQVGPQYGDRQYVMHTLTGTAHGQLQGNSWTFQWTAPETNVGAVIFYAAGNAANGDEVANTVPGETGDYIYTTMLPVPEPGAVAGLAALGAAFLLSRGRLPAL